METSSPGLCGEVAEIQEVAVLSDANAAVMVAGANRKPQQGPFCTPQVEQAAPADSAVAGYIHLWLQSTPSRRTNPQLPLLAMLVHLLVHVPQPTCRTILCHPFPRTNQAFDNTRAAPHDCSSPTSSSPHMSRDGSFVGVNSSGPAAAVAAAAAGGAGGGGASTSGSGGGGGFAGGFAGQVQRGVLDAATRWAALGFEVGGGGSLVSCSM